MASVRSSCPRYLACWAVEFNYKCPFNTGWQQWKWPFQVPRPLNRGVRSIKVWFKESKGNKFGDFGYCLLNRGCPLNRVCLLNAGFAVFLFLNLEMVPWNSTLGGFAYIWQSKWVEIIAIKTERTQILFKHLLVTVASLDLRPRLASSGGNSGYTDREESEDENGRKNGLVAIYYIPRLVISWYSAKLNFLIPAYLPRMKFFRPESPRETICLTLFS